MKQDKHHQGLRGQNLNLGEQDKISKEVNQVPQHETVLILKGTIA